VAFYFCHEGAKKKSVDNYSMKASLRKIVVEGETFFWGSSHRFVNPGKEQWDYYYISSFVAFRETCKRYLLRILFKTVDAWPSGSPLNLGTELNLNLPSLASQLISYGIKNGWNAEIKKPIIIEDGLQVLESLGYETDFLKK
jgi:hypothetical protein